MIAGQEKKTGISEYDQSRKPRKEERKRNSGGVYIQNYVMSLSYIYPHLSNVGTHTHTNMLSYMNSCKRNVNETLLTDVSAETFTAVARQA